jgi:nucleoside-diphosphate-sugar epimerase
LDVIIEDFDIIEKTYEKELSKLQGKKLLVTGSYGMITSYLCSFLIHIMDRFDLELYLQGRNERKLRERYGNFEESRRVHLMLFDFEKGELPDIKPDYILHAASAASTKYFVECPVDVLRPNTVGTWNLLNYAKENNIEKFLFFSSNSIYGEGGVEKVILSENDYGIVDPLNDRSCYIESKRMSEQMCAAFWKQYKVPANIIRICHTYGPTFDVEQDTRIIPRTIKKILSGSDVEIYRDPDSVIQYTYIADMVAAILLIMLKGNNGEAYNAGSDEIVKMDDVIAWMLQADPQIKSKLIEKEIDGNYNFAKGKGINFLKLSNEKLRSLGWRQLFSNEEGFKRMVKHYLTSV